MRAEGFTVEDKKIANRVMEAGRALLIVANKWDLVEEKDRTFKSLAEDGERRSRTRRSCGRRPRPGRACTVCRPLLLDLHERWTSRVSTAKVNEVIQQAQRERPTPRDAGHPPLRDAGRDRARRRS